MILRFLKSILHRGFGEVAKPRISMIAGSLLMVVSPMNSLATEAKIEARVFTDGDHSLPYRILKPDAYAKDQKYPLIIALHGALGRGIDNQSRAVDAFEKLSAEEVRKNYPTFVITPQCPAKQQWVNTPWGKGCYSIEKVKISKSIETVFLIIASLQKEFNIDADRIYVTGQSMGGYGNWDIIMRKPELFAAAVPVCGAGDLSQVRNLANVSIWCFHGGKDTVVPVAASRQMDQAMKEAAHKNWVYTEYPNVGHGASKPAWQEKELIPWLFKQKRGVQ